MKLDNWKKWWGASILKVDPEWKNGGRLIWENGDKSDLSVVIPQKKIQTSSNFLGTTFHFKSVGTDVTVVEYEFNPRGGASFSDGGRAHLAAVEAKLARLKTNIENETPESNAQKPGKWWKFWK